MRPCPEFYANDARRQRADLLFLATVSCGASMKLNLRLTAAVAVVWVETIRLGGRAELVRLRCETVEEHELPR
jgi:hypothetical protein